jgi:WXG100 family type VII secretion target
MDRYRIDLDELLAFADRLKAFDGRADEIGSAVDGLVAQLHGTWHGEAAAAHQARHDEWMSAAAEMREAVAELHVAASKAHQNYTRVIELNTAMWP